MGFAADADFLVAAESRVRRVGVVAIGPHPAGLDVAAHAVGAGAVAGPYTGTQAIDRVVGDLQGASSLKVVTASTGPKISSWKMRILL